LTFPVHTVNDKFVVMDIDGVHTDFTHKEVLIVDLNEELQNQYNDFNWGYTFNNVFKALEKYAYNNGILHKRPEYICPA